LKLFINSNERCHTTDHKHNSIFKCKWHTIQDRWRLENKLKLSNCNISELIKSYKSISFIENIFYFTFTIIKNIPRKEVNISTWVRWNILHNKNFVSKLSPKAELDMLLLNKTILIICKTISNQCTIIYARKLIIK